MNKGLLKKERDSNMELLRCVAMFLVVLVHTGFLSLGLPTQEEAVNDPMSVFMRFLTQSASVVCVNVFVLLSGWYGIRFNKKRLGNFLFQVLFFSVLIYVVLVAIYPEKYLNVKSLSMVFLLNGEDYWFVKSYLLLFLLAPFLNGFLEEPKNRNLVKSILGFFFLFQTIYGWIRIRGAIELEGGYSALFFMGLYVLMRYIKIYGFPIMKYSSMLYMLFFCVVTIINALVAFLLARMNVIVFGRIFTYTNPLVILQSLALIFAFSRFKFQNRFVNWIAISSFSVYLTHSNGFILRPFYGKWINFLFENFNTFCFVIYVSITIAIIFLISTLIDKIRLYIWMKLEKLI